ncbi:glycosyltransferase [Zunongwangia sp. F260]|uniref:Glycosyltransferase n=1 Tax=Autumnicola lenta TaxID=3075593 RepID=A0ABU3CIT1_9FLAO|nr:glycosyltransferase [Zunongwangia sp. F260]MDT0646263.1 glycosyltransferase [Zunongwangia sp. F260]
MKISICIPTYHRPDLLVQALESCFAQTFPPIEILIGDDSKNDETEDTIDNLKQNFKKPIAIRYFHHKPSLGQAANVNYLIRHAKGDKLVLLHDDDLLMPQASEKLLQGFINKKIKAVFGKHYLMDENGNVNVSSTEESNQTYCKNSYYEEYPLSTFESGLLQQFPNNCYMIDRHLAQELEYSVESEVGDAVDFDFGFRLGLTGHQIKYIDEYVSKYRISAVSVSRSSTYDAAYRVFQIVSKTKEPYRSQYRAKIDEVLRRKAPLAIVEAVHQKKSSDAFAIYLSKWHREKIFTPQGIGRFLTIMKSYIN